MQSFPSQSCTGIALTYTIDTKEMEEVTLSSTSSYSHNRIP